MKGRLFTAAALAAVLFGAASHRTPLTIYRAPAGTRPAGPSPQRATAAVLLDGRIAAPLGDTIFVGTNPQGVALSPDGRYVVVSNDGASRETPPRPKSRLVAGYSLAVVDTATMRVVDVFQDRDDAFTSGIAVVRDPRNPAQTLVLASDGPHDVVRVFDLSYDGVLSTETSIPLPVADAPGFAGDGRAFPSSIAVSRDGRTAYVVESIGQIVAAIDIATRAVTDGTPVGLRPFPLAVADGRLYVLDAGLATYRTLARPAPTPEFGAPDVDPERASSLATIPLERDGGLDAQPADTSFLGMDPIPDGVKIVGGIIPSALVVRSDGRYAYAALSNVDRIAIVSLQPQPRVVNGLDLRLFPNAPYGTQPSAEALSADGSRLYVALAGLNAIAVLNAHNPVRLHRLGLIPTGWYPSALALSRDGRFLYVTDAQGVSGWGMLQRIDLRRLPLGPATLSALRYNRSAAYARPNALVPPLRSLKRSDKIRHVVYLSVALDSINTPNLRALATQFSLAGNIYAPPLPAMALQMATAANVTLPVEREAALEGARAPFDGLGEDPDDYPRAGFIFNALARAGETFRDYGALEEVSGYRDGSYTLGIPLLAALAGNTDLAYPAQTPRVTNRERALDFVRDYDELVRDGRVPDFMYVWLPPASTDVDTDEAVGTIVDAISHSPQWSSTAIFIVSQGVGKIYGVVVSPYARRGFVDREHLSTASVVKTEEEILGLPPLGIDDLLATDLAACFVPAANRAPFQALGASR
jgi:DNA-binding beta-propeller fold protein YncE